MKTCACFPGSFDPFTKGHEDIVKRALTLFDEVIIAIGENTSKQSFFDKQKRLEHISSLFNNEARVSITFFQGLTVDFCANNNCTHIVRGLRDTKDFNYEQPIALLNRDLAAIETVFLLPNPQFLAINSTIIREIYKSGGQIDQFVTNAALLV